jgi:hypothetical protein
MRIDNPDVLPYYIMEKVLPVLVHFAPLEAGDDSHIATFWPDAIYFDLWHHVAQYDVTRQTTLKLIVVEGSDDRILGLVRMGSGVSARAASVGLNTQSVLETAPRLQFRIRQREYKGVGKVLVARLIAESVLRDRGGALIVTPRPQAIPFYLHLGFQPMNRDPKLFFLREETGVQLLQSVLLGSKDV